MILCKYSHEGTMSAHSWLALKSDAGARLRQWRQNCRFCACTTAPLADRSAGGALRWRTQVLVAARKQATSREILLWMTPSEAPKALQASECSELLDPTGASYWIFAQRQPGKFAS